MKRNESGTTPILFNSGYIRRRTFISLGHHTEAWLPTQETQGCTDCDSASRQHLASPAGLALMASQQLLLQPPSQHLSFFICYFGFVHKRHVMGVNGASEDTVFHGFDLVKVVEHHTTGCGFEDVVAGCRAMAGAAVFAYDA